MRAHLPVYADGELADDLRSAAERHLAECERCRRQVERWQALRRGAQRAVASEALPPGLEQRLRQRLRAETGTAYARGSEPGAMGRPRPGRGLPVLLQTDHGQVSKTRPAHATRPTHAWGSDR